MGRNEKDVAKDIFLKKRLRLYYIRIESIANIFSILTQFALVALVTVNKSKYLYALTGARLVLCLVSDTFLVSTLPVSANLGVNGIGYSNIS
jgi:hypothetical protein